MFGLFNNKWRKTGEEAGIDEIGSYHRVHIEHKDTGRTFQVTERGGWYSAKDNQSGATQINMDEGGLLGFIARHIKRR